MAAIDFLRFAVNGEPARALYRHEKVNACFKVDGHGEVLTRPVSKVGEVRIWFDSFEVDTITRAIVNVCLPKYYNGNNHSSFSFTEQQNALKSLIAEFGLPTDAPIMSFEFGYNIKPPFEVKPFLDSLAYHHGQSFYPEKAKTKNLVRNQHERYEIKLYDKALQHNLPYPLLRYEIRVKKMEHVKRFGIRTLADLMDISKLEHLQKLLLKVATETIIIDHRLWDMPLTPKEMAYFQKHGRRETWEGTTEGNRDTVRRVKKRLNSITSKYLETSLHQLFIDAIKVENERFGQA